MTNSEMIKNMIAMQNRTNKLTCGSTWKEGICEKTGKKICWETAFMLELAEFIDSFYWKWWKSTNIEDDILNAKVEVVDLWHFVLSYYISLYMEDKLFTLLEKEPLAVDDVLELQNVYVMKGMFFTFEATMSFMDMDIKELYSMYLVKNILNKLRQNKGYADGTYCKIWNGVEDNKIALEIIDSSDDFDSGYNKLEKHYEEMQKS